MKLCRKCQKVLSLAEFYKHAQMADGHLNICKECVRERVSIHRERNVERIREYDRLRSKQPHRVMSRASNTRRRRMEDRRYGLAHSKVSHAVNKGTLVKPDSCLHCGENKPLISHHPDYDKPLDVIWVCQACHCQMHRKAS